MDCREDGMSQVCKRSPDGRDHSSTLEYLVIIPTERIEYSLRFTDSQGEPMDPSAAGLPQELPAAVAHIITQETLETGNILLNARNSGYATPDLISLAQAVLEPCPDKKEAPVQAFEATVCTSGVHAARRSPLTPASSPPTARRRAARPGPAPAPGTESAAARPAPPTRPTAQPALQTADRSL